jgi:aldehyde:ferredoxin oxidoreductase
MKGNTGKIIEIDLSTGKIEFAALPEDHYKKYIGGSGLAAKYFWEKADFKVDPLSSEALLLFMNGPFAGLKLSGASRSCVAGRSPLTGNWGDSSCGGFFAPELRYAGYDGIAISGKADAPVILHIAGSTIELLDASPHAGAGIEETTAALKKRFGKTSRTLVIGPAGEKCVPYACIIADGHHAHGRAGFGAVMGSKNLKAIVVKAEKKEMDLADPDTYQGLRKAINTTIKESLTAEVLKELGTSAKLEVGVYDGDVPIKNWTSNYWEEMAEALTGSTLAETYLTRRSACAFCSIACKRIVAIKEGPFAIPEGPGPEYETIVAFGSLLGAMDLAAVCKAGRVCNDLGLDTISTGSTIAWAMEAFEKGDLSIADTGGIDIRWGDMQTVIDVLLPNIAAKTGKIGRLLSAGSVAAAKKTGKGSIAYTTHSKGLEAPMHDPRGGGHGLALAYAISPRGGCHVSSPMLSMEAGARYYPEIDFEYDLEPMTDENKAEAAVTAVELGSIENSACFCEFADREITITQWRDLFNAVAGYGWDIEEMMRAGRRVFFLKRLINYRYGCRAADDALTPRMLSAATDGEPEGILINFIAMKKKFYQLTEIDPDKGIPTLSCLETYQMEKEAALVW